MRSLRHRRILETLHGVNHWMLEEKPDAVADLLPDWITARPSSA
jgi:hypothetical protein